MLPIQLSSPIVAETPALEQKPVRLVISDRLSSASYKAIRLADQKFRIVRLENDGFPEFNLGVCAGEDRAKRFLDWWVANDRRVQVLFTLLALGQTVNYSLVDLMIEAAQQC